ncbi:MAG: hypothetical protein ACM3IJ_04145, partial [Candidatus Levyibacteriota bacterium]
PTTEANLDQQSKQVQAPVVAQHKSNLPTVIAILCVIFGLMQIALPVGLLATVIPAMLETQSSIGIKASGLPISYIMSALLFIVGILNVFFGISVLRKKRFFLLASLTLILSFILQVVAVMIIITTIMGPIYSSLSTVGPKPSPTPTPKLIIKDASPSKTPTPIQKNTTPIPTPTIASSSCKTNADCPVDYSCMTQGPIIAGQPPQKICVKKGSAIPL